MWTHHVDVVAMTPTEIKLKDLLMDATLKRWSILLSTWRFNMRRDEFGEGDIHAYLRVTNMFFLCNFLFKLITPITQQ